MPSTCVVPGCTASSENNPNNRIFHVLPKEPNMCAKWLEAIGLHKYADNLQRKKGSYRVCSDHFDESSYETKFMLLKTAVPNLKPQRSNKLVIGGSNAHPVGMNSGNEAIRTEQTVELDEHALRVEICRRAELEASMSEPEPSSSEEFLKYSRKFLDSNTLKLITCQMLMKKSDKRKFPIKYRLFCLALYYHNPRAYGFLQQFMKFPPVAKLQITHLNVNSGHVSPRCLHILKSVVSQMKATDRYCVVGIASIVLKKHVYYDIRNDKIQGLHQVTFKQSRNPAKKAYVLVVRGLLSEWQMPVAFALFHNSDVGALQQWTDSVIRILMLNGLDIRAFVSNQGDSLRRSSEKNAFVLMNKTIYNIFDVRYLLQRIRDCLMRFDMLVPSESVATWDQILKFYKAEKKLQTNLAPCLTRFHLLPDDDENQTKSCELAVQLFSKTVASAMNAFIGLKHLDASADATVNLIYKISNLLDLLNLDTLEHNSPASKNSLEELSKAFEYFDSVRRVTKSVSVRYAKIEPVVALTATIKSILDLRRDMSDNGSSRLLPKSLNLEFVEDCFREICAHGKKRKKECHPTSIEFIRGFNRSFLNNFIKNARRNSSKNLKSSLSKLHKYLAVKTEKNDPLLDLESKHKSILIDNLEHKIILPNQMVSRFLAGYLMTKAMETHHCDKLMKYLNPSDTVTYSFIDCHYLDMKLPIEFVLFVVKLEHEFINVFRQEFIPRDVGATALKAMSHLVILPCPCFPLFLIKKLFTRIRIYNVVKDINKQLKTVDVFKINTYDL